MDDRKIAESPHDLLLALAGRVDDDLLAWCRELVAVGEDGRAVELACATLAAARAELPPAVRAALVGAARAARTDLDADAVLRPAREEPDGTAHRFDAAAAVVHRLAAVVAGLPGRQVTGCRLHVTARTTPAGTAPGPVPQPVVVVEIDAGDPRPADVLAYQLAIACARAGAPAAVEVVVDGAPQPGYQRAALRSARPVVLDAAPPAGRPAFEAPTGPADPAPADSPLPTDEAGPVAHPRSSLADRMAAWDSFDLQDTEPGTPDDAAPGPDEQLISIGTPHDTGSPDVRTPAPDNPSHHDPMPHEPMHGDTGHDHSGHDHSGHDHSGHDDAAVADPAPTHRPDAALPVADRRAREPGPAVRPHGDPVGSPAAERDGAPDIRQVPFGRASTDPLSFGGAADPTGGDAPGGDPVIDGVESDVESPDERPRWPATGSLVLPSLPRRAPADRPQQPDPPPAARPAPRPTALHPKVPPAPGPSAPNGHRPRPLPDRSGPPRDAAVRPLRPGGPDTPALASLGDPFTDPIAGPVHQEQDPEPRAAEEPAIDAADPLGLGRLPLSADEQSREPVADSWLADWLTGDWATPRSEVGSDRPVPRPGPAVRPVPRPGPPVRPVPRPAPPPSVERSAPAGALDDASVLRSEPVARLNDDDRELLARLQSELGSAEPGSDTAGRPRVSRRAGIAPNGRSPRTTPPDIAG